MNKLNSILNTIFIVWIVLSTIAFTICAFVFKPGELLGELFELYILALLCAVVGLILSPEVDYYKGYIPEPDRSEEQDKIQRELYESGHDMSKPNL